MANEIAGFGDLNLVFSYPEWTNIWICNGRFVKNFRGPMEMLKKDSLFSMFRKIGLCVGLKNLFKANGFATFGVLKLFIMLSWVNYQSMCNCCLQTGFLQSTCALYFSSLPFAQLAIWQQHRNRFCFCLGNIDTHKHIMLWVFTMLGHHVMVPKSAYHPSRNVFSESVKQARGNGKIK
jgi:hypothetical protein